MPTTDLIKNRTSSNPRRGPIPILSLKMVTLILRFIIFFVAIVISYVVSFAMSLVIYVVYFFLSLIGYD